MYKFQLHDIVQDSPLKVEENLAHLKETKMFSVKQHDKWKYCDRNIRVQLIQNHLVHGQVQGPEAEKHHAVSETLYQSGSETQCSSYETQQLHGGVRV